MLSVAVMALRATRVRALALAATGTVAVFGSVAVEGAKHDLVRGLHHNFGEYLFTTDLWITTGDDDLATANFRADDVAARIREVPSVAAVRPYFGGLLDVGDRRVWVIARASRDRGIIPKDQLADGNLQEATQALRHGGAIAVSAKIADAQHAGLGDRIVLPTPTGPRGFRIAATLNNLGWGPGAVILNAGDYRRAWAASDPTAIEVDVKPGTSTETA
jgi:putative ABC transport system permease protein